MRKSLPSMPIRVKQFPNFVKHIFIRTILLLQNTHSQPTFHLCYFSCNSYFKYLYCSLHSLLKFSSNHNFKIYVFNDNEQPLSDAQILSIQNLIPGTKVIPWPKSMGWGANQIKTIWQAYGEVAEHALDNDIVARVDSDVFFFNDIIFRAVAKSDADLIGDGHYVNFEYTQGGCYFFRADAIKKIVKLLATENIENLLSEIEPIVEDIAAHHFARHLKLKIWLTWFMMFPDELRNAGGITKWMNWKFSCLHFVMKNKKAMLTTYQNELLQIQEIDSFSKIINTE
ncbi:glycosyltransferase family A protein [Methylomonas methanica]|nr:glycosyltransferase family A protein [Methylomonas methanica]